jgi:two-component system, NarL family, nitrate/nitrite response regulator NarL
MLHNQSDLSVSSKAQPERSERRCASLIVVSDIRIVRDGIAKALAGDCRLQLFGAVAPENAVQVASRLVPDVALLDIRTPEALDTARALRASRHALEIVAIGVAGSDGMLLACAQAGISGFVAPEASTDAVVAAIESALRGELVCSPRLAGMLLSRIGALAATPATNWEADQLTPREHGIAVLMGEGLSNKQIAFALGIQNATVKNHVHNILSKMRLSRRSQVSARLRSTAGREPEDGRTLRPASHSAASRAGLAPVVRGFGYLPVGRTI